MTNTAMTNVDMGYTTIRVLHQLVGKPWSVITGAYVSALRPSTVRVVTAGAAVETDAVLWRVTVYLTPAGCVEQIEQEVEVALPPGARSGYELDSALRGLG